MDFLAKGTDCLPSLAKGGPLIRHSRFIANTMNPRFCLFGQNQRRLY